MATHDAVDEIKSRSGWAIFMGVLTAALGLFLVLYPMLTATITTVLLAWTLIFVGIAQFIFALHSRKAGQFFWKLLSSIVYVGCGALLAAAPIAGVAALTGILGWLLLIQGVLQAITAFGLRPLEGWGWYLFDAVWAFLLGVLILAQWPFSSAWAIGTLVGVSVLMSGISRILIAGKIRTGATAVERLAHGRA